MNTTTWAIFIVAVVIILTVIYAVRDRNYVSPPIPHTAEDVKVQELFKAGDCTMYSFVDKGVQHYAGYCSHINESLSVN